MNKNCQFSRSALNVIAIESEAIAELKYKINSNFTAACELAFHCKGRIVVTGLGKSGHIGKKIAATLASTGTPAFFVHPSEANHGDLGMITPQDVVLAISNSGETEDFFTLMHSIKRLGAKLISVTGNPQSTLAQTADINIDVSVTKEACPLGLAPTASTTATLVMGDAIAIALLEARQFSSEDFARIHPGGTLGRRLLLRVDDVMHRGATLPKVTPDTLLTDALFEITEKRLGMTTVVNAEQQLIGVFTDGDLRRALDKFHDIRNITMGEVMTTQSITLPSGKLAVEALHLMEEHKITALVVVSDAHQPAGIVHMHDLLRAGIA